MTEGDKKTLSLFIEKAKELQSCDLLQSNHKISFSLNVSGNQGVAKTSLPREEQLRSFLLIFRNFYSPSERIQFSKVCRILIDNLENDDMKRKISEVQTVYDQTLTGSPLSLVENDAPVAPNEVLRRWLYGHYHHTDVEKREKIDAWGFAVGLTKMQFVSTVFDLAKCVVWLNRVASDYITGKIK